MPRKKKKKPEDVIANIGSDLPKAPPLKKQPTEQPKKPADKELTATVKEKIFAVKPELKMPKEETEKPKGTVKVKVLVDTLQFEDGVFEKGDTFTVSKKRVKLFDPRDIEILKG